MEPIGIADKKVKLLFNPVANELKKVSFYNTSIGTSSNTTPQSECLNRNFTSDHRLLVTASCCNMCVLIIEATRACMQVDVLALVTQGHRS